MRKQGFGPLQLLPGIADPEADGSDRSRASKSKQRAESGGSRGRSSRGQEGGRGQKGDRRGSKEQEAAPAPEAKTERKAEPSKRDGDRRDGDRRGRRGKPADAEKGGSKRGGQKRDGSKKPASLPDRPEELLRRDGRILVKVTKEPISAKGSRVSTDISLAGRFLVLVPAADYVAVSKKIESARERRRLKTLATSLRPDGFGIIVRTVAEDRDAKTLDTDLQLLLQKWRKIETQLAGPSDQPQLLYEDVNMVSSIIRDLFTEDYDRILVDDPKLHKNVKAYVQAVAPHMADRVQLHRSNTPVFRSAGLEKAVEQVFSTRVPLPSGGYLFIEHTEAMHVVDVNSGRAGRGKSQAENLLAVNLEAARAVAKQLRLRDLGGIIVVDFIDMRSESARRKVYQALKDEFRKDRAVTKLLPMSDFGLVEITRQRLRPSITAQTNGDSESDARDPAAAMAAAGASEIPQPERDFGPQRLDEPTTTDEVVERIGVWLKHYRDEVPAKYRDRPIVVRVHPLLAAYLRRGFPSPLTRWRFRLRGLRFSLETEPTLHPLEFEARDEKSGKPLRNQYDPSP
ncbi:MAG: Rne/Rng family ribonuclease [Rubricoccaceae bacterium]|nr:Rne/Rng family ribonuclease [Rubricoccaceae bacterium]